MICLILNFRIATKVGALSRGDDPLFVLGAWGSPQSWSSLTTTTRTLLLSCEAFSASDHFSRLRWSYDCMLLHEWYYWLVVQWRFYTCLGDHPLAITFLRFVNVFIRFDIECVSDYLYAIVSPTILPPYGCTLIVWESPIYKVGRQGAGLLWRRGLRRDGRVACQSISVLYSWRAVRRSFIYRIIKHSIHLKHHQHGALLCTPKRLSWGYLLIFIFLWMFSRCILLCISILRCNIYVLAL